MATTSASHPSTRSELITRGTILALVSAALGLLVFVLPSDEDHPTTVYVVSVVVVVLAALFCWGLWNLRRWGGIGTVVVTALNMLISIPALFQSLGTAITIVIAVIVVTGIAALYFILQPAARAAWNRKS